MPRQIATITVACMPSGCPHASWLRQMESYLRDMGSDGLDVCLGDGQTESEKYRREVDAATRCSGVCSQLTCPDSGVGSSLAPILNGNEFPHVFICLAV